MPAYENNRCWMAAHQLVMGVYEVTESFPKSERYGLVSQLRRAAVSVASNIVEGLGRTSAKRELAHFCKIARGSLAEVGYQSYLAKELGFLKPSDEENLQELVKITRMRLDGFIRHLAHK